MVKLCCKHLIGGRSCYSKRLIESLNWDWLKKRNSLDVPCTLEFDVPGRSTPLRREFSCEVCEFKELVPVCKWRITSEHLGDFCTSKALLEELNDLDYLLEGKIGVPCVIFYEDPVPHRVGIFCEDCKHKEVEDV